MSTAKVADFSQVTETWGIPASREQLAMQYCRYRMAGDLAAGKEVLEVGCGSGMGLAYLAAKSRRAVGVEFTPSLLAEARRRLPEVEISQADAQQLPFEDRTFDVVLMLEMIYYVPHPEQALAECRRILRPGGALMVCSPNPERLDFNPSPLSVRYFTARELAEMIGRHGFEATLYGGFPPEADSSRDKMLRPLRRIAVRLRLIPGSMRAKAMVKRILYGRLPQLGAVRDGVVEYRAPTKLDLDQSPVRGFKNLYAVGQLRS
jgi:SAM-dependent methyltransferase